jgi:uncharacterized membrane protein YeaQ/YmgE (transglycosylase-associated protein family)
MINVLLWCIAGGVSGVTVSRLSGSTPTSSLLVHLVGGCLGALIGGTIFTVFDTTPLATLSISGLGAALLGALVTLSLVQTIILRIG